MNRRCQCHLIIDYQMDEWYPPPMSYPRMSLKHERLLAKFLPYSTLLILLLKTLFRNLCTCFHFLPVLSWTPLGTQRNTWFLLHFLGVKAKRYIHHECDILSGWPLPQGVYRGSWFMIPYNWDSPLTWNSVWQLNHASQFPAFSLL